MNPEKQIEQLLRWHLAQSEAEAPPAPRASRLLDLARPWWETWPDRFQSLLGRVSKLQVAYGHAMVEPRQSRGGHPVAAILIRPPEEIETVAHVLYLNIRDDQLRLRFQIDGVDVAAREPGQSLEVTFVSDSCASPLFSAQATLSVDGEYRLEAELPAALARDWRQLKVTTPMPFRWIVHHGAIAG